MCALVDFCRDSFAAGFVAVTTTLSYNIGFAVWRRRKCRQEQDIVLGKLWIVNFDSIRGANA